MVDNDFYGHVACPPGDSDSSDNQAFCPIPPGKIMLVQVLQTIYAPGLFEGTDVFALFDGFMI